MGEIRYAKEPVDYKLAWLRFRKKIWMIPVAMLVGALLVLACHYFSKMLEKGGRTYETTSVFYLDFATAADGSEYDFINYYTWGELIHSDYFIDSVYTALEGNYSREYLIKAITATIESDVRYLYVRCTTNSEKESLEIAQALEPVVIEFADTQKEFNEIRLSDRGDTILESTKLRLANAAGLGAALGLFVILFILCVYITVDSRIYIPATIERRYAVRTLGAECMSEYPVNCREFLGGLKKLAYVSVDGKEAPSFCTDVSTVTVGGALEDSKAVEIIKACDGLVIGVDAGKKNDKMLERYLDEFARLNIKVTAIVLTEADEKLINSYYRA